MTGKTHSVIALSSLLLVGCLTEPKGLGTMNVILMMMANSIGAMLPDIDQASNKLWSLLPIGNVGGRLVRKIFLGHRTITHSILGVWIVYELLKAILPMIFNPNGINSGLIATSLMVGYISHLLADSLTEEGLPIFFPLAVRVGFPPIRSWRIKTGRWFENLIIFPGVSLFVFWLLWTQRSLWMSVF